MISLILCHPTPGSFNHAIADQAKSTLEAMGHEVALHDLYAERFAPVLPGIEVARDGFVPDFVARHCNEIAEASGIVVVHPNWWGMPPAILKGWIDRVLRPGVAYEFLSSDGGEGVPVGLLKPMTALVFNTSNTPAMREREVFGDPLERIWRDCVLDFCGVRTVQRRMFGVVCTSSPEERAAWLHEVAATVRAAFGPQAASA